MELVGQLSKLSFYIDTSNQLKYFTCYFVYFPFISFYNTLKQNQKRSKIQMICVVSVIYVLLPWPNVVFMVKL
jgi:hypothetical protein